MRKKVQRNKHSLLKKPELDYREIAKTMSVILAFSSFEDCNTKSKFKVFQLRIFLKTEKRPMQLR